jgi:hypothetical protein
VCVCLFTAITIKYEGELDISRRKCVQDVFEERAKFSILSTKQVGIVMLAIGMLGRRSRICLIK